MLERQDVTCGTLSRSQSSVARAFMARARILRVRTPRKSTMPYRNGRNDEEGDDSKERHHHLVRDDGVEIRRLKRRASHEGSRYGCTNRRACCERHQGHHPGPAKRDGRKGRPGKRIVRFYAQLRQGARHVDVELVRWRVLTRIQTFAAVVTEVCEVREIRRRERHALFHRLKHRAVGLAVAAGVAHDHLVLRVPHRIGGHIGHAPARLVAISPLSRPAISPNTVPIVIPTPATYPRPRMLPAMISPAAKMFSVMPPFMWTRARPSTFTPRYVKVMPGLSG